eukprot:2618119-Amphidinium_carterae.1
MEELLLACCLPPDPCDACPQLLGFEVFCGHITAIMSQSSQEQTMDAFEEWCRSTFEGLPPQADERVILLLGQT